MRPIFEVDCGSMLSPLMLSPVDIPVKFVTKSTPRKTLTRVINQDTIDTSSSHKRYCFVIESTLFSCDTPHDRDFVPEQLNSDIEAQMTRSDTGRWQCLSCGWETDVRARLWEHVEAAHLVTTGYSCELCAKFCSSKNAYKIHKSRYHK